MSAARSRPRNQVPGDAPQQAAPPEPYEPRSRRLLVVTLVLAAGWSLALLLMDLWTAGKPVVGPGQILKADVVAIARRLDSGNDRVEVERVFKGPVAQGSTLRVVNLPDVPQLETGKSYIMALSHFRDDFAVTRLEGQRADLLVYPSTPATIQQTKAILREVPGN
jgi:hypothetical protein